MVDILMATYNGEKYIKEQIESILNQTYQDWILYIRDDGSKDNTLSIIKSYIDSYPNKIYLVETGKKNMGAKLNFSELMKNSKSDYCMFCDQDDVWNKDKIEVTLNRMLEEEGTHGKNMPILVHTDLMVVDDKLNVIDKSFFNYIGINYKFNSTVDLVFFNTVTGCTMMINKALSDSIKFIPKESHMHDHWIAMVASYIGKISTINSPTIMYRQHSNNTLGAVRNSTNFNIIKIIRRKKIYIKSLKEKINTVKILYNEFSDKSIKNSNSKKVYDLISLEDKNFFNKKFILIKNNLFVNKFKLKVLLFFYS